MERGLLPILILSDPQAGILESVLDQAMPMRLSSQIFIVYVAALCQWVVFLRLTRPRPYSFAKVFALFDAKIAFFTPMPKLPSYCSTIAIDFSKLGLACISMEPSSTSSINLGTLFSP